jgi:glycosyltransferase involved in cell wall biosynthesis
MKPDVTVVIPTLNGARGLARCLAALNEQLPGPNLEVIVVDDGSSDDSVDVARRYGATVISHPENRGVAAARNTGARAATADIVAYMDDDCEPEPDWAFQLCSLFSTCGTGVVAVGGRLIPHVPPSFLAGYLARHNPLAPVELNISLSNSVLYRFALYLKRQWSTTTSTGRRDVYSIVGANMAFRRTSFEIAQFDERLRFGPEELDICLQLVRLVHGARVIFEPAVGVKHHFKPGLRDTFRRSRAYGLGAARLYRKWPAVPPTIFPAPFIVFVLLASASYLPLLAAAGIVVPLILYPQGLIYAIRDGTPAALLDGYVQLIQEACANFGFITGLWRFRRFAAEPVAARGWVPEQEAAHGQVH